MGGVVGVGVIRLLTSAATGSPPRSGGGGAWSGRGHPPSYGGSYKCWRLSFHWSAFTNNWPMTAINTLNMVPA